MQFSVSIVSVYCPIGLWLLLLGTGIHAHGQAAMPYRMHWDVADGPTGFLAAASLPAQLYMACHEKAPPLDSVINYWRRKGHLMATVDRVLQQGDTCQVALWLGPIYKTSLLASVNADSTANFFFAKDS